MPAFSAKDSTVKIGSVGSEAEPTAEFLRGNCTDIVENEAYSSNKTGGRRRRVAGIADWTGELTFKEDDTTHVGQEMIPGTETSLIVELASGVTYSGTVLWGEHEIGVDVNGGTVPEIRVPFGGTVPTGGVDFARPT